MHLNPILKNVLGRTACIVGCLLAFVVLEGLQGMNHIPPLQPLFWIRLILLTFALVWTNIYKLERPLQLLAVAGSWIAYIVIYYCLNRLEVLFSPDDFFIDGHPTARTSLLMIASAILIWMNIRKLLHPIQRIYFSIFLLILTVLIGAWKVGAFYYDQSFLLKDLYLDIFPDLGLTFVFAASLLPIFFAKWTMAKHDKKGKAWLLVVVLLFDFTIASPNIFDDEMMGPQIYHSYYGNFFMIKKATRCFLLSMQDSQKCSYGEDGLALKRHYSNKRDSLWISYDKQDTLYVKQRFIDYRISYPNGETYFASPYSDFIEVATNCWQYNAWYKFKRLFRKRENE